MTTANSFCDSMSHSGLENIIRRQKHVDFAELHSSGTIGARVHDSFERATLRKNSPCKNSPGQSSVGDASLHLSAFQNLEPKSPAARPDAQPVSVDEASEHDDVMLEIESLVDDEFEDVGLDFDDFVGAHPGSLSNFN